MLAISAALASASAAVAASAVNETTGGVTNTWTNYTNAGGTAGPRIPAYTTVLIACKLPGFRVANGNTWWYRIASAPWSNSFYASADAFYNNGQTSGSLVGTPWVDPAVPDCGAPPVAPPPPPAPQPSPSVQLAQGPAAPAGYRYTITLDNFPAGSRVAVSCRDSVNPGGFFNLTLTTDSRGHAFTQSSCYSGDGPEHWVVAGGLESNRVRWGAAPRPPAPPQGTDPGSSDGDSQASRESKPKPAPEACRTYRGVRVPDRGSIAYALYDHYMWGNGRAAVIDWSYFATNSKFVAWAKAQPVGVQRYYVERGNADLFLALGTFSVTRTSANCYAVYDHYDFAPSAELLKLPDTVLTLPQWSYQLVGAREYDVHAAGRL